MNIFITILISLLFSIIPLKDIKKANGLKSFLKLNYLSILFSIIIFIGCFIRLYKIDIFPIGLNQDEASAGYEAFSISNFGIDRNGLSFPIHFISWGSGQNALYIYLIIPFINIISNPVLAIRLPMALIGCLTLLFAYYFIRQLNIKNKGLIALFILAIVPWHIMKSRWGLESNLFPDICFYAFSLLYLGIKNKQPRKMYLASILFGISTYSYGTSYEYIPIFLLITYIGLIIFKKIQLKDAIKYFFVTGLIALPMILFVVINYFNLDTITVFNISIPKLYYNRFASVTSVNGNFILNSFSNLIGNLKILFYQKDNLVLNCINDYGIVYYISLPFILYGFVISIKNFKNDLFYQLLSYQSIASLMLMSMIEPNINHINIVMISLIMYLIIGLVNISSLSKILIIVIMSLYMILFVLFVKAYFTTYQESIGNETFSSLGEAITYAEDINYSNLYIDNGVNQPYIYYLLYNRYNIQDYLDKQVIKEKNVMFQYVEQIDNVYFYLPNELEEGNTYIIANNKKTNYNYINSCKEKVFENYSVIAC